MPILDRTSCLAEKLLAHADRGRDDSTHARDLVDLAFMAARWLPEHAASALTIAEAAYGAVVARELYDGLSRFEDSAHRRRSVEALGGHGYAYARAGVDGPAEAPPRRVSIG